MNPAFDWHPVEISGAKHTADGKDSTHLDTRQAPENQSKKNL